MNDNPLVRQGLVHCSRAQTQVGESASIPDFRRLRVWRRSSASAAGPGYALAATRAEFDFGAGQAVSGLFQTERQGCKHLFIMKLGHSAAAGTDQKQTGIVMTGLVAGDELVGAGDLVRESLFDEKIQRAIHRGGGRGRGMDLFHAIEQIVGLETAGFAEQKVEHLAPDRREARATCSTACSSTIELCFG